VGYSVVDGFMLLGVLKNREKRPSTSSCVCPAVRMEQLVPHWSDFREILYLIIYRKFVENLRFHYNPTGITGAVHEDLCPFIIVSR